MGLPFEAYHAGQIIFGPADGYLYFMIGDASHIADPYNFAQNKKSLIGKILRLDVDNIPSKHLLHVAQNKKQTFYSYEKSQL